MQRLGDYVSKVVEIAFTFLVYAIYRPVVKCFVQVVLLASLFTGSCDFVSHFPFAGAV